MNDTYRMKQQQKLFQDIASILERFRKWASPEITGHTIRCYWEVGRQILHAVEGQLAGVPLDTIKVLTEQLKATYSRSLENKRLWSMVDFARKYGDLDELPGHSSDLEFASLCEMLAFNAVMMACRHRVVSNASG